MTTSQLHRLMLSAFGWAGGHLHYWSVRGREDGDWGDEAPFVSDLNPDGYLHPKIRVSGRAVPHPRPDLGPDYDPGNHWSADYDDDYGLPPDETMDELDARYDLTANKHVLFYEYETGDGWEHVTTVERRRPGVGQVSGGKGHCAAEDVGGTHGWKGLKWTYEVKNTPRDTRDDEERREWYENMCRNGDPRGLKGKARLEYVNLNAANKKYQEMEERAERDEDEDSDDSMAGEIHYYGRAGVN